MSSIYNLSEKYKEKVEIAHRNGKVIESRMIMIPIWVEESDPSFDWDKNVYRIQE